MSTMAVTTALPNSLQVRGFGWASKRSVPLAFAIALLCLVSFGLWLRWESIALSVQVSDIVSLLAPLVFAAAVIERGVEILVSPWRDAQACKLQSALAAIKARSVDPATAAQNAADLQAVSDALDEYSGQTQRYAFAVSLTLSILASTVGIRVLGPFLDTAKFHTVSHAQQLYFLCLDVGLSAALLAGGADGLHSIINAVITFFDATAQKAKG